MSDSSSAMTVTTVAAAAEPGPLPGERTKAERVARMIRVNQAGEYGAQRIYEGQLAILGRTDLKETLEHMAEQEQEHLRHFSQLVGERHVRPTAMQPIWHVAGFALGAATALMGRRAAMACTVAVEEEIDSHYAAQYAELEGLDEEPLREAIERFRQEELEHRDIGLAHEAELAPAYKLLYRAIRLATRSAIKISERV